MAQEEKLLTQLLSEVNRVKYNGTCSLNSIFERPCSIGCRRLILILSYLTLIQSRVLLHDLTQIRYRHGTRILYSMISRGYRRLPVPTL